MRLLVLVARHTRVFTVEISCHVAGNFVQSVICTRLGFDDKRISDNVFQRVAQIS